MSPGLEAARYEPLLLALERGDAHAAERLAQGLIAARAGDAEAWRLRALGAVLGNDARSAFAHLARALALDPRSTQAWCNLASIYQGTGQHHESAQAYRRALALEPECAAAWNGLGILQDAVGDHALAAEAFERAHAAAPGEPGFALNLASSQLAAGQLEAAERTARATVDSHAQSGPAHFVLGNVLAAQGRHDAAISEFRASLARNPAHAESHFNLALALDEVGAWHDAARACENALALEGGMWPALAQLVFLKRRLCEWQGLGSLAARLRDAVRDGRPGITPFSFLAEPASPAEQRRCASTWAAMKSAEVEPLRSRMVAPARPSAASAEGPTVGFVSSGFNNHPTALLVVELIERLRALGMATVAYATSAGDGGALRRRIAAAFGGFREVHGWPFERIAARVREDDIDVLVDLRGYGGGAATEVFALRPAPIQVNWLAYPGTSGAGFIDYLIADARVVPAEQRAHYSESVAFLPHCFQPSDTTRALGTPPGRTELGLPGQGVVFASFNNSYKVSPDAFGAWMRILRAVPGSVLWLLSGKDEASAENLRSHAQSAGVEPSRLVFMQKLPHEQYLARFAHVDLFLDSWPYNAHTTASDALWAGCPVLSLPGETFASRVAASLLHAAGLPQLVADDVDDYVARAIRLGGDAEARARLRGALAGRRETPLFDMVGFARHFRVAIATMHDRHRRGLAPSDFTIAPDAG